MQSRSNRFCYGIVFVFTLLRVILTKPKACPQNFDCNSYIAMVNSITYDPAIAGHHAMRILPSLMARGLEHLGFHLEMAFRILSGGLYVIFGLLTFWFFRKFSVKPLVALGFTLLVLSAHHVMRIPLQLVYQTCDIMTYPLALLMIYCSIQQQTKWLVLLSFVSLLVRQNLFILGELSLLYCFWQSKQTRLLLSAAALTACYVALQSYYHATSTFAALLQPPENYFTIDHLWFVLADSKILELFIPLVPFLIFYAKPIRVALWRYWHIALYGAITAGQPLLGYHMTGANLPRLALQGIICLYLLAGLVSIQQKWTREQIVVFLAYSIATYVTWGIHYRLMMMVVFGVALGWLLSRQRTALSDSMYSFRV